MTLPKTLEGILYSTKLPGLIERLAAHEVRLLLEHDCPFTIICVGGDCQDQASGDHLLKHLADKRVRTGMAALAEAQAIGWRNIHVADDQSAHFYGTCPNCTEIIEKEMGRFQRHPARRSQRKN